MQIFKMAAKKKRENGKRFFLEKCTYDSVTALWAHISTEITLSGTVFEIIVFLHYNQLMIAAGEHFFWKIADV